MVFFLYPSGGTINFDDINHDNSYSAMTAYSQSKLANVLFSKELSKRLEGNNCFRNLLYISRLKHANTNKCPRPSAVLIKQGPESTCTVCIPESYAPNWAGRSTRCTSRAWGSWRAFYSTRGLSLRSKERRPLCTVRLTRRPGRKPDCTTGSIAERFFIRTYNKLPITHPTHPSVAPSTTFHPTFEWVYVFGQWRINKRKMETVLCLRREVT